VFDSIIDAIKLARDAWPKRWSNVEVRFFVEETGLGFVCDDKSLGVIRVTILNPTEDKIAYLEGGNSHDSGFSTGFNVRGLPEGLLADCFHMARCFREFERTGNVDYANGFQHFRDRAVQQWQSSAP
jgi:hypothetical protein